ncbi:MULTISPECIES: ACP S-malonyltransferase [Paenibacillus]|uniref:[acyl-carrier-protein] S-malonyltransferase n=1 Tax=Paenibacillus alvei TaxID=44250 RepID=A0ABT4E929_PAEAL|nr:MULTISPECIES: ACP S-malonyltransferase [Paenibacillus]EPY11370.1 malonyl CoA-acyl carrier protein transacylase [Paenibacillus alvei A6-6i-x]MCY9530251.1 ACP S-malonyltransferase [Paenibacillus alvei]SDF67311.1 [acyl-carrier-protein] S-malonyltransferase [Paenibacillus sp. cl6col]
MKRLAFLFPGQGSQFVGMGKQFYDNYKVAKDVFEEASDTLGLDFVKLCFDSASDELARTENTQPAILTMSVAAYKLYMELIGFQPAYAAGHSLGEFSALTCAGVITFADALQIVRQRGIFMQEAVAEEIGAMCAIIGMRQEIVEEECKKFSESDRIAVISNYNSPQQTVISGHRKAVNSVAKQLEDRGARVSFLRVSAPFHSPLMEPAACKLHQELLTYKYNQFDFPVISNVSGRPYRDDSEVIETLTAQMTSPVRWNESMQYLVQMGINHFVELGPQNILTKLLKDNEQIVSLAFGKIQDVELAKKVFEIEMMSNTSNGEQKNLITKCLAAAVCTKNNNWDNEAYRSGVIESYKKIEQIQQKIDLYDHFPTVEELKEAIYLLKTIFETKQVPLQEQQERFKEILEQTGTTSLFSDILS